MPPSRANSSPGRGRRRSSQGCRGCRSGRPRGTGRYNTWRVAACPRHAFAIRPHDAPARRIPARRSFRAVRTFRRAEDRPAYAVRRCGRPSRDPTATGRCPASCQDGRRAVWHVRKWRVLSGCPIPPAPCGPAPSSVRKASSHSSRDGPSGSAEMIARALRMWPVASACARLAEALHRPPCARSPAPAPRRRPRYSGGRAPQARSAPRRESGSPASPRPADADRASATSGWFDRPRPG